jgi:CheY-like chemotaxis protein
LREPLSPDRRSRATFRRFLSFLAITPARSNRHVPQVVTSGTAKGFSRSKIRTRFHGAEELTVRLLVVEDDPLIREFVVEALREEGHQVIHAADGIITKLYRTGSHHLVVQSTENGIRLSVDDPTRFQALALFGATNLRFASFAWRSSQLASSLSSGHAVAYRPLRYIRRGQFSLISWPLRLPVFGRPLPSTNSQIGNAFMSRHARPAICVDHPTATHRVRRFLFHVNDHNERHIPSYCPYLL